MPKYLLSVHTSDDAAPQPMSADETRRGFARIETLETEMRSAGAFVLSARLDDVGHGRVVRPSGKRVRITDGPYTETKEHLGGFYIIEAADLDAALDWASKVTLAIDSPIEVRPFVGVVAA